MAVEIATACGRSDLFAAYTLESAGVVAEVLRPVVGFDSRGRALIVTKAGKVVLATRARVAGMRFRRVGSFPGGKRT